MVKKNNTKKMIWDVTNVKSVEDIKPSLTKSKILSSGINISELEELIKHTIHTVYTDIEKDVKKITPWYKSLWNKITRKK